KSTFAKLISGRLSPQQGEISHSKKLKVGYFAQHQVEEFDLEATGFEHVLRKSPSLSPTQARSLLAGFGLMGQKADIKVRNLSGGEKARLNLTLICLEKPNILVLDEPTNHLDMDSRQALMMALNEFQGAVILITHDWDLLASTMDQLWLVADHKVTTFEGDLEDYRRIILKGDAGASKLQKKKQAPQINVDLKKKAYEAKLKVEALTASLEKIKEELNNPDLYTHHSESLGQLMKTQHQLEHDLSLAEEAWLKAEEDLESVG
ncbi:MAG: ATP-binding cassette domain-containing protein, partial [Flavobacteriales bacterium]|nr:ATP-binding cassette domain-containing protein [Flavobacteriales bacterium]